MPTPGAAASVRGFAAGQFDGYYGADVAFHEIAGDTGCYKGFEQGENELLQSFWAYTLKWPGCSPRTLARWTVGVAERPPGLHQPGAPIPARLRARHECAGVRTRVVELDTGLAAQSLENGTVMQWPSTPPVKPALPGCRKRYEHRRIPIQATKRRSSRQPDPGRPSAGSCSTTPSAR